ncbi:MAG: class II SORL domain-containing protein [Coriobacteriia bacterium]|nr:class II SORL domain-containing protein [Coriobacteriia bacterium]
MVDSVNNENEVAVEIHVITDMENATEAELKHTPNIELVDTADGQAIKVTMGLQGLVHPQTEEHLTEWIKIYVGEELVADVAFGAGEDPEVVVNFALDGEEIVAQAQCNLHGIWEARL